MEVTAAGSRDGKPFLEEHLFLTSLPQQSPRVVFSGAVAGLADRYDQGCRIQRHLGD